MIRINFRKPKKKSTTAIDDDGFLVAESFDPFATGGSNPFTEAPINKK